MVLSIQVLTFFYPWTHFQFSKIDSQTHFWLFVLDLYSAFTLVNVKLFKVLKDERMILDQNWMMLDQNSAAQALQFPPIKPLHYVRRLMPYELLISRSKTESCLWMRVCMCIIFTLDFRILRMMNWILKVLGSKQANSTKLPHLTLVLPLILVNSINKISCVLLDDSLEFADFKSCKYN